MTSLTFFFYLSEVSQQRRPSLADPITYSSVCPYDGDGLIVNIELNLTSFRLFGGWL